MNYREIYKSTYNIHYYITNKYTPNIINLTNKLIYLKVNRGMRGKHFHD